VAAYSIGYRGDMVASQSRHRPRRISHETTGMLSYQRMACLQFGQAEGGRTTDRPAGTRNATTLRNEPITNPNNPATMA
jgi:hypothetical protein